MTKKAKALAVPSTARAAEEEFIDYAKLELLLKPVIKKDVAEVDEAAIQEISLALSRKEEAFFHYLVKKIERLDEKAQLNLLKIAHNLISKRFISLVSPLVLSPKTSLAFQLLLIQLIQKIASDNFQEEKMVLERVCHALDFILSGTETVSSQVEEIIGLPREIFLKILPLLAKEGPQVIPLFKSILAQVREDQDLIIGIIEALGHIDHSEAVSLLQGLLKEKGNKLVLKAVKRSLYQLKTKGLETEEMGPPIIVTIPRPDFKIINAWASRIDPFGYRLVLCSKMKPLGGVHVIYLILKEIPGIEKCWVMEFKKKEYQSFYQGVLKDEPCIEISSDHLLFLFYEALDRMNFLHEQISEETYQAKSILGDFDMSGFQHPVYSSLHKEKIAVEGWLLDRADKLLEQKECAGWQFLEEKLRKYYDEIRGLDNRTVIVSPQFKQAETTEIYEKALMELVDETMRKALTRRLEETAYLFVKTDRLLEAKMAIAAAVGLEKGLTGKHPILKEMLKYSLELIERKEKGEASEEVEDRGRLITL
ncbi:MAG: hypothetical protein HY730_02175 [Candidatus Tectomicrobia bacterium]|uniref:HEAT repeat domain-containing protein n=1 Tax=Tectimicrobiota bacterium TaxID=2528274 RepID=A0A933GL62_UNCTE|nr:hypothetical protein [Candidatus Tectomicrobia bacterium]